MSLYILDTDTFSNYQRLYPVVIQNILSHLSHRLAITIITVEEQTTGWQTLLNRAKTDLQKSIAYEKWATAIEFMSGWEVLPFPLDAIYRYDNLLRAKLNVRAYDLRIAAIALETNGIVVTHNRRDFQRVPGLIFEDWSA